MPVGYPFIGYNFYRVYVLRRDAEAIHGRSHGGRYTSVRRFGRFRRCDGLGP
jgi:hypothetical protein